MADVSTQRAARPSLSRQLLPAVHGLLARPLSSYYLLIASSGLLLLIGLTMVFSATSVEAYAAHHSAFGPIANQALYALLGLVAFWICQRLPATTLRYLGKPILWTSIVLLALLDLINGLVKVGLLTPDGNKVVHLGPLSAKLLWLYLGPVGLQPGELVKLGMVLWGADVIARKGARLGEWRELARPLFPVIGL